MRTLHICFCLVGCFFLAYAAIVSAEDGANKVPTTYSFKSLSLELASKAAWGALKKCRKQGYAVAVAVLDRGGNVQALLRDGSAGPHAPETAIRKTWSANTFRQSTASLASLLKGGDMPHQAQHIPGILLVGGALTIAASGHHLGAIGVSSAPADVDHECAIAGIEVIQEDLDFDE